MIIQRQMADAFWRWMYRVDRTGQIIMTELFNNPSKQDSLSRSQAVTEFALVIME